MQRELIRDCQYVNAGYKPLQQQILGCLNVPNEAIVQSLWL